MYEALILYPRDPDWVPDSPETMVEVLHNCGLIDLNRITGERYEFGNEFARLINFLGCSPTLYDADSGHGLFHILLPSSFNTPQLVAGDYARPRCRRCKKPIVGWLQYVESSSLVCPHCGKIEDIGSLHWRRQGAVTRTLIVIEGIMEGIAVPTNVLLVPLQSLSHSDWDYLYYCDSKPWS